jgi:hypothetical protein
MRIPEGKILKILSNIRFYRPPYSDLTATLLTKKPDKLSLRKKLFLASFHHLKEDLENQIVNYEHSKTKSFT